MERILLPAATTLGHVHLTVSDLGRVIAFYRDVLGLGVLEQSGGSAALGVPGRELLRLQESRGATRPPRATGLYHFAPRVPSRTDLGRLVRSIGQNEVAVQGMVDHHTHEAVYLADPEGNGIELYVDRPRELWPSWEDLAGRGNAPLDVESLLAEAEVEAGEASGSLRLPEGTVVGHIHLHVADLAESDAFYVDLLGLDLVGRFPGQAHFTSAGGYHHHLAYNVWAGRGAPAPPPGSRGLKHFTLLLPDTPDVERVVARLAEAGHRPENTNEGPVFRDPSHNGVLIGSGS
jgi:catechol 2,3-dioxygenase